MNEEEKRLLDGYSRLSRSNQLIALAQITAGAEMEESARKLIREAARQFYNLVGPDTPLFNGAGLVPGPAA